MPVWVRLSDNEFFNLGDGPSYVIFIRDGGVLKATVSYHIRDRVVDTSRSGDKAENLLQALTKLNSERLKDARTRIS